VKALFVITRTNEMHKHIESFTCLNGNSAVTYTYDHRGRNGIVGEILDKVLYEEAKKESPDLMVYVGACAGNIPSPQAFRKIRDEICPTVIFVSDAADKPWWPPLNEYEKYGSFTVQVALDGADEWPGKDKHITALTPLDPQWFENPPIPHEKRKVVFGFAGNLGPGNRSRRILIAEMIQFGLQYRQRSTPTGGLESDKMTYQEAAKFMSQIRIMPNTSHTGSYERFHVKGRVVEAGWAGSLLLELAGSPTPNFFEKDVDYLEYKNHHEARRIVMDLKNKPEETQAFGERLRKKVIENHSPQVFWKNIFERLHA
jgi:hypothetical protein